MTTETDMLAVALSTQQELVNALALIQLSKQRGLRFSRVDSLQTETAVKRGWSSQLKAFLLSRASFGTHCDVPFGFGDESDAYHPDRITEHLFHLYGIGVTQLSHEMV